MIVVHRAVRIFEISLRALSLAFLILAVIYLWQKAWIVGVSMGMLCFLVSVIGQGLPHRKQETVSELASGISPLVHDGVLSSDDAFGVAKAMLSSAALTGLAVFIIARHQDFPWYSSLLYAVGGWFVFPVISAIIMFTLASRRKRRSFSVGPYKIDSSIQTISDLTEASADEYAVFGRFFVGEEMFHAPAIEFLGFRWRMMLGAVNHEIFKVAPYFETSEREVANRVASATLAYCKSTLGTPKNEGNGMLMWRTNDGNVILQTGRVSEGFAVNLFITSRKARSYDQLGIL